MKIKVSKELNYNLEAYIFLLYQSTDKPYKQDFKNRILKTEKATKLEFENIIKDESKIYYEMEKNIHLTKENKKRLKFYFDKGKENNSSLAMILLSYVIYDDVEAEKFSLLSSEKKLNHYMRVVFSDNGLNKNAYEDGMSQDDYENLVDELDISLDFKYKYLLLYRNHEKYFNELMNFMEIVKGEILKHTDSIDKKLDCYEQLVMKRLKEEKADNFFGFMDFQIEHNGDIVLRPSFLASGTVVITSFMKIHNAYPEVKFKEAIIYFGVNVLAFSTISKKHDIDNKKLLSIFKTLGDNSKYEILTSLKGERMYAAEIAKKLNVTNATVSYHMRNLFQLALVKMVTDNNRVYYTLNEETIRKVVALLKENFYE